MEGVLASGLTPCHGGHRAHPCLRVPGLGLFLPLSAKQSALVVLWLWATVTVCVCTSRRTILSIPCSL